MMIRARTTQLTVVLRRQERMDAEDGAIRYSGYDIFWPDGRPVRVGLRRFCQIGSRLLVGRRHEGPTARVTLTLHPVAGLEAPLTRPGGGIRTRRFYALRGPEGVRLHFLDGTPTEVVFDPAADEREVIRWLQAERMRRGVPFWFDLAIASSVPTADDLAAVGEPMATPA